MLILSQFYIYIQITICFLKTWGSMKPAGTSDMVWLMYFKWLKNLLFHVLTPGRSMYKCSRNVVFNIEAEFLRAPSGVFSSWCAAVLKGIMNVNLATARRNLMSCTGLDLTTKIKFVTKWKQCQGKKIVTPEKRNTWHLTPEILHLKQLEWFL